MYGKIDIEASISFDELIFQDNQIVGRYSNRRQSWEVQVIIKNPHVRAYHNFLKSYIKKRLGLKKKLKIRMVGLISLQGGSFHHQAIATSEDLSRISADLLREIDFSYIRKLVEGRNESDPFGSLLTNMRNDDDALSRFTSDKELVREILFAVQPIHQKHIEFLSEEHETEYRIRLIKQPLAFLFILKGSKDLYLVWETFNTKEATYIWKVGPDQDRGELKQRFEEVKQDMEYIKQQGRLSFIGLQKPNFYRIEHKYEDTADFQDWKDKIIALIS